MKSPSPQGFHTRREFLRTSVLGGALGMTVPLFLEKTFLALDSMSASSGGAFPTVGMEESLWFFNLRVETTA
jgi:hypothetical protein